MTPAVFLDRDGTLNEDRGYVYKPEDWEWIPGAVDALKRIRALGFKLVVATNQSGVARGLYTTADVEALHRWAAAGVAGAGVRFDGFYFCPHGPKDVCLCRKPLPGMVFSAAKDLDIDLARSFFVGDKARDLEAGRAAGVRPILVLTGYGETERLKISGDVPVVKDLSAAAEFIARALQGAS